MLKRLLLQARAARLEAQIRTAHEVGENAREAANYYQGELLPHLSLQLAEVRTQIALLGTARPRAGLLAHISKAATR